MIMLTMVLLTLPNMWGIPSKLWMLLSLASVVSSFLAPSATSVKRGQFPFPFPLRPAGNSDCGLLALTRQSFIQSTSAASTLSSSSSSSSFLLLAAAGKNAADGYDDVADDDVDGDEAEHVEADFIPNDKNPIYGPVWGPPLQPPSTPRPKEYVDVEYVTTGKAAHPHSEEQQQSKKNQSESNTTTTTAAVGGDSDTKDRVKTSDARVDDKQKRQRPPTMKTRKGKVLRDLTVQQPGGFADETITTTSTTLDESSSSSSKSPDAKRQNTDDYYFASEKAPKKATPTSPPQASVPVASARPTPVSSPRQPPVRSPSPRPTPTTRTTVSASFSSTSTPATKEKRVYAADSEVSGLPNELPLDASVDDRGMDRITRIWWQGTRQKEKEKADIAAATATASASTVPPAGSSSSTSQPVTGTRKQESSSSAFTSRYDAWKSTYSEPNVGGFVYKDGAPRRSKTTSKPKPAYANATPTPPDAEAPAQRVAWEPPKGPAPKTKTGRQPDYMRATTASAATPTRPAAAAAAAAAKAPAPRRKVWKPPSGPAPKTIFERHTYIGEPTRGRTTAERARSTVKKPPSGPRIGYGGHLYVEEQPPYDVHRSHTTRWRPSYPATTPDPVPPAGWASLSSTTAKTPRTKTNYGGNIYVEGPSTDRTTWIPGPAVTEPEPVSASSNKPWRPASMAPTERPRSPVVDTALFDSRFTAWKTTVPSVPVGSMSFKAKVPPSTSETTSFSEDEDSISGNNNNQKSAFNSRFSVWKSPPSSFNTAAAAAAAAASNVQNAETRNVASPAKSSSFGNRYSVWRNGPPERQ